MSHVGVIVHSWPAHIPGDKVLVSMSRHEHFLYIIEKTWPRTFSLVNELSTLSLGVSPMEGTIVGVSVCVLTSGFFVMM